MPLLSAGLVVVSTLPFFLPRRALFRPLRLTLLLSYPSQGAYTKNEPAAIEEVWSALLSLFAQKKVRGIVYDKIFGGLEAVPAGLKALGQRETWGKAVIEVVKADGSKSKL